MFLTTNYRLLDKSIDKIAIKEAKICFKNACISKIVNNFKLDRETEKKICSLGNFIIKI